MERKQRSPWPAVGMWGLVAVLTGVVGLGLLSFDRGEAAATEDSRLCTKTAHAASRSCLSETREEFWIAIGNCHNLSEREDQKECKQEAGEELWSAREECRDQYDARTEICEALGEGPYDPQLDPADFVDPDDIGGIVPANPYFPVIPGTVWVYEGETDEGTETITVTITEDTKEIEYPEESGLVFTCRVVRDVVQLEGDVIEDTNDWYCQDVEGNVWYFGEIAREFEDGELVSLEGSWKSGVDGAKPGIIMKADPQAGDVYRQEFLLGEAEDMGAVISIGEESVTVPFGTFPDDVLKTRDYTPIEPDVFEFKYYVPDVGAVLEENPDTGERVELIDRTTP